MKQNIFKEAVFGDKFKTRDGRDALYLYSNGYGYFVIIQGNNYITACMSDGSLLYPHVESCEDIIDRVR